MGGCQPAALLHGEIWRDSFGGPADGGAVSENHPIMTAIEPFGHGVAT
jgi:hypothetical protein